MSVVGRWWWYIRISVANTRIALWVKTYLLFHIGKKETRKTRNPGSGVGDDGGCWREPKAKSLLKIDSRFSLILSLFFHIFFLVLMEPVMVLLYSCWQLLQFICVCESAVSSGGERDMCVVCGRARIFITFSSFFWKWWKLMENVHPADRQGEQVFFCFPNKLAGWYMGFLHFHVFLPFSVWSSFYFFGTDDDDFDVFWWLCVSGWPHKPTISFSFFSYLLTCVCVHVMWVSGVCVFMSMACVVYSFNGAVMLVVAWFSQHNKNPHALIPPFLSYQLT